MRVKIKSKKVVRQGAMEGTDCRPFPPQPGHPIAGPFNTAPSCVLVMEPGWPVLSEFT